MSSYRELFSKSQATIANTIEDLEIILEELKKCMLECEDDIKATPHKDCTKDAQSDFSSDCIENSQEY